MSILDGKVFVAVVCVLVIALIYITSVIAFTKDEVPVNDEKNKRFHYDARIVKSLLND